MLPQAYKIEFPDGSSYIGATCCFARRRKQHLSKSRKKVNALLSAKMAEFPICGTYVLASACSLPALQELEALLIAQEQPELNVNLSPHPAPHAAPRKKRGKPVQPKPFGPYPSRRKAAVALGLSQTHIARLGSYEKYLNSLEHREMVQQRITVGGVTLTIKQWAARNDLPISTIHARLRYGWTEAEAVGEVARNRQKAPTKKQLAKQAAMARRVERQVRTDAKVSAPRKFHIGCDEQGMERLREYATAMRGPSALVPPWKRSNT